MIVREGRDPIDPDLVRRQREINLKDTLRVVARLAWPRYLLRAKRRRACCPAGVPPSMTPLHLAGKPDDRSWRPRVSPRGTKSV